jgi:hypothetical protein
MTVPGVRKDLQKLEPRVLLVDYKIVQTLWKKNLAALQNVEFNWAWWYIPIIPGSELEASVGYA